MHFNFSADLASLASYLPRFLAIVGEVRWFKRVEQLDADQKSSFFMWKIVSDHHWLEMAIGHQYDVLSKEGRLIPELADPLTLAALHFAGSVVEIHTRLSERGRRQLEGRLRDSLKAGLFHRAKFIRSSSRGTANNRPTEIVFCLQRRVRRKSAHCGRTHRPRRVHCSHALRERG